MVAYYMRTELELLEQFVEFRYMFLKLNLFKGKLTWYYINLL